jgi:hypothetical protein
VAAVLAGVSAAKTGWADIKSSAAASEVTAVLKMNPLPNE